MPLDGKEVCNPSTTKFQYDEARIKVFAVYPCGNAALSMSLLHRLFCKLNTLKFPQLRYGVQYVYIYVMTTCSCDTLPQLDDTSKEAKDDAVNNDADDAVDDEVVISDTGKNCLYA